MATTQQPRHRSNEVERAQALLRQPVVDRQEVLALIKPLKAERAFGTARKLLDHALKHPAQSLSSPLKLELAQKLALCTYKDPDHSPATAHRPAGASPSAQLKFHLTGYSSFNQPLIYLQLDA